MKVRHSTTPNGEKRTDRALTRQWNAIDWDEIQTRINRLQARIAKATCEGNWNLVQRNQTLFLCIEPPDQRVVKCASRMR